MNKSSVTFDFYQLGATSAYTTFQPSNEESTFLNMPTRLSDVVKRFIRSLTQQPQAKSTTTAVSISSKTITGEMPAILANKKMSAEDRVAQEKGLALAAHIEHLYRTDQEFRRWYHEGIDEIEGGHFVTFSEDGWKEK